MSIPGLGQIPAQVNSPCPPPAPTITSIPKLPLAATPFAAANHCFLHLQHVESTTRIITLRKADEWRFRLAPGDTITVKLLAGTAERDGVELAQRSPYRFTGSLQSKITTWQSCDLEIDGRTEHETVASFSANPTANPATSYLNLHGRLADMRLAAARERREGPRVLVTGGKGVGKTSLVRTLASYATRQGQQPIVVNADPNEGMLSLAGTLSAGVFATVMDPVAADGWGSTPTSGPSVVPVKLPLVYYYGRESAEEDAEVYRQLVGRLAGGVSGRLSEDPDVKGAGVLVDGIGIDAGSVRGLDLLAHMVDEFSGTLQQSYDAGTGIMVEGYALR